MVEPTPAELLEAIVALSHATNGGFAHMERRFEQVDRRFEQVDLRFAAVEGDLRGIHRWMARCDAHLDALTPLHRSSRAAPTGE